MTVLALALTAHAGSSICRLGDVNGDGIDDLAVASCDATPDERVWVLSGKDGKPIHEWRGASASEGFGQALASVDDVDSDGVRDVAVLVAGGVAVRIDERRWGFAAGGEARIVVRSGRSGALLRVFEFESAKPLHLSFVGNAGDWDRDGHGDVVIGLTWSDFDSAGEVRVLSGKDGRSLMCVRDLGSVACCVDFDTDGQLDLCIGDATRPRIPALETEAGSASASSALRRLPYPGETATGEVGAVFVVSGATSKLLTTIWGSEGGDCFGANVVALPNMDGAPLFAVAASSRYVGRIGRGPMEHEFTSRGAVRARRSAGYSDEFGSTIDVVGDLDGDGTPELVVGANEMSRLDFDEGYALLWSPTRNEPAACLALSRTEGVDACGAGDVNGDGRPDIALSMVTSAPKSKWRASQRIRVVTANDETIWERSVADLRAERGSTPK